MANAHADICTHTINREVICIRALSIDAELSRLSTGSSGQDRSGRKIDQWLETAAAQRHILNELLVHGSVDCRLFIQKRRAINDVDSGFQRAYLERDVYRSLIIHIQNNILLFIGTKPFVLDFKGVGTRRETGDEKHSLTVCCRRSCKNPRDIDHGNFRARDDRTVRIRQHATECCRCALGRRVFYQ